MNFYIDKLLLWLKNGDLETLQFRNDKINIITGNSKTGKTAILEIINYCFCGGPDTVVISDEHIGENVSWYGIRFSINDKIYTIARGEISASGDFSDEYYFSQSGEIPDFPFLKLGSKEIKEILETEFSIDDEVTLSYGGKGVRRSSILSFRYFLIYSTLSKDIIDNGRVFFDRMNLERYRNVWQQVFDLALGIVDFSVINTQNAILEIQQEIYKLEQRKKHLEKDASIRDEQKAKLVKKAKEAAIIDEELSLDDSFEMLESLVRDGPYVFASKYPLEQRSEKLLAELDSLKLQVAKLQRFKQSYEKYRDSLRLEADALKPVTYIEQQFSDRTSGEYRQFLSSLSEQLKAIRSELSNTRPFEYDVKHKIRELKSRIKEINDILSKTPQINYRSIPTANKLIAFGEISSEIKRLAPENVLANDINDAITEKGKELSELESKLSSVGDKRQLTIDTLNEYIQAYITIAKDALDEYGDYRAWFDYKNASLALRKNKAATTAKISSSSDHLYMHLCLFAGLHHFLLSIDSPFVPSYLIIDQPSRPYFSSSGNYKYDESRSALTNKDDWSKVKDIFRLWDSFFSMILSQGKHFQVILLEHVSEDAWAECEHVNLVAVFDGINTALIPVNYTESKMSDSSTDNEVK